MNYLQYINSVYSSAQSTVDMRYLVGGVDSGCDKLWDSIL